MSNITTFKKESSTLKEQITSLQEKVNAAKANMRLNTSLRIKPSFKEEEKTEKAASNTSITLESTRVEAK